jgi:probable phosphoglycerate mutase
MVYRRAAGMTLSSPRDFEIPNAALNRVEATPGEWRVAAWAEVAHLERALDDLPG